MQQTETYKLNKPETTDVFTPAPLNENADKLESELTALDGAIAGIELRPCLIKLGDAIENTQPGASSFTFRIPAGVDLTQYRALVLAYYMASSSSAVYVHYNGTSAFPMASLSGTSSPLYCVGWTVLVPEGEYIYALTNSFFVHGTNSRNGRTDGNRFIADWAALDGEFKVNGGGTGSRLTIYGLRA